MRRDPVLLTIDTTTCRVRRYVGRQQTLNIRFDRLPVAEEIKELRNNPRTFLLENTNSPEAA